jgi:hypothetical protein
MINPARRVKRVCTLNLSTSRRELTARRPNPN